MTAVITEEQRAKQREYSRRWRERNPEKDAASHRASRQRNRERLRAYEGSPKELARRAAAKRRLRATNPEWAAREREHARVRRGHEATRVWHRAYLACWRAAQAGARGSDACTIEKIEARCRLYGNRCAYCGCENANAIDHVIPLSRGGTGFPANIVPACGTCNRAKSARTPTEYGVHPSRSLR